MSKIASPLCSRIVSPRIRPSSRISSRSGRSLSSVSIPCGFGIVAPFSISVTDGFVTAAAARALCVRTRCRPECRNKTRWTLGNPAIRQWPSTNRSCCYNVALRCRAEPARWCRAKHTFVGRPTPCRISRRPAGAQPAIAPVEPDEGALVRAALAVSHRGHRAREAAGAPAAALREPRSAVATDVQRGLGMPSGCRTNRIGTPV